VLGGGAAGSSAARLLALWGHRVHVITRPSGAARLAVSLPPSCGKLFDALGVSEAIARAGFIRSTGNTVWWGSADPRVELFAAGNRGWQVELDLLEQTLQAEAIAAGATIERRVLTAGDATGLAESIGGGSSPRYVLDCSGRTGLLARHRGGRRHVGDARTVALIAAWRIDAQRVPTDDTHTLVESYADGWMWSVPSASGDRHVAAMIDPQRSALARGGTPREIYLAEIAKTRIFRALTAHAVLRAGPWGWDASTYSAGHFAGPGWLLAGDAGSFIDPLSSAGVKKALASGWLAAVTAHTCLSHPDREAPALAFFSAREREVERHHTAAARRFLAGAALRHPDPFWAERSGEVEGAESGDDPAAIRAALDRLRAAEVLNAQVDPSLTIERRPAIAGHEIVLERHVVTHDRPEGVRYIRGVDIIVILELAPACPQVPALFEAYCRRSGPVPLHDFLAALAATFSRGWLVAQ
jgi:flavin-dependent dehydrogenase